MKHSKIIVAAALGLAALAATAAPASAAHYCVETPAGVRQTNGNGNRGNDLGWRNSSSGQARAAEGNDRLFDCGEVGVGLIAPVNGR